MNAKEINAEILWVDVDDEDYYENNSRWYIHVPQNSLDGSFLGLMFTCCENETHAFTGMGSGGADWIAYVPSGRRLSVSKELESAAIALGDAKEGLRKAEQHF